MVEAQSVREGRRALLIAGPTASGKSALAIAIAQRIEDPLIINCDAMQVYRDLRLLTARPSVEEMDGIPHHLFGHVDGACAYSVASWRDDVANMLAQNPQSTPIFVGGTGLYFKVLLEGIAPIPDVDPQIRQSVRDRCEREGPERLHAELDAKAAAKIRASDSQRVCRALEVLLATGRSLIDWQNVPPDGGLIRFHPQQSIVLEAERTWLETRIHARAAHMVGEKGVEEVRALLERGLADDLPVMRALGVSTVRSYLQGALSQGEAHDEIVIVTRRYAKRQMTWFRGQMADWRRADAGQVDPGQLLVMV